MSLPSQAFEASVPVTATPTPRILRPQRAMPADALRPTRADVNMANLRHNLGALRHRVGSARVWAVLKADGYGHGAKAVARTLERAGVDGICVALLEEGIELREAGIRLPLLVMGGHYGRAWEELLRFRLTPVLHDVGQVASLAEELRYAEVDAFEVHLKIDTGMGRLGVMPGDVAAIGAALASRPAIRLAGLMTHFACADSGDTESIEHQLRVFESATRTLRASGLEPSLRHAANSAALLATSRAHLDIVRPGVALFGVEPRAGAAEELRPVMSVRTAVVSLRELEVGQSVGYGASWVARRRSRVATVPVGYADGLHRAISNKGAMLVRGRRAPIVGIISMDMTMIDVTDLPGVALGDECVVLGAQRGPLGQAEIRAPELAEQAQTIPWEILTSISRRVPRFYREP